MASNQRRRARPHLAKPLMVAAAAVVVVLAVVPVLQNVGSSSDDQASAAVEHDDVRTRARSPRQQPWTARRREPASGPVDAAKIVKTGTLDLQVPHGDLARRCQSRHRRGGRSRRLCRQQQDELRRHRSNGADHGSRPGRHFETAITRLEALPGVKVLGESENGTDVTAQYADLQHSWRPRPPAEMRCSSCSREAETVGDILAVQDRVTAAQTQVEQLQRRINVLGDQAAFSSLAVTLSEKPTRAVAAPPAARDRGIAKAWADARHGFSSGIEWIIARSGGALDRAARRARDPLRDPLPLSDRAPRTRVIVVR